MSEIILINPVSKNGRAYTTGQIAVDTADIAAPIMSNAGGNVVVQVINRGAFQSTVLGGTTNIDTWEVSDSLADIAVQSANLFTVPIIQRKSTVKTNSYSPATDVVFYLPSIYGVIEDNGSGGSTFKFPEGGNPVPVEYQTSMSPSVFVASLLPTGPITGSVGSSFIPYADGVNSLADSTAFYDVNTTAVRLMIGTAFGSEDAGETLVDFGGSGEEFNVSTDSFVGNESGLSINTGQAYLYSTDGGFNTISSNTEITHSASIVVSAPEVVITQNIVNSGVTGESRIDFAPTGDNVIISTDAGTLSESFINMDPSRVVIGNVAGPDALIDFNGNGPGWLQLKGTTVELGTLSVLLQDSGAIDIDTILGSYSLFGTNAAVVNIGHSTATVNCLSTLNMSSAKLQLAAGTTARPSINITNGVAPTTPADGDIWFDGTDLKMRVGGVTKTFTLV